jgi:peptidylprolyl isomerase
MQRKPYLEVKSMHVLKNLAILACSATLVFAQTNKEKAESQDFSRVSKAFGHIIAKNLQSLGSDFDVKSILSGIEESLSGKPSPMSEEDTMQAVAAKQEESFKKESEKNLKEAENFLEKNKNEKGVVSLEDGKVQYKKLQSGDGLALDEKSLPVIKYVGKYLDSQIFGQCEKDKITLNDAIIGFRKGLIGMKKGEKRMIYVHPELGYGSSGYMPRPNTLLSFEVELLDIESNVEPIAKNESSTQ